MSKLAVMDYDEYVNLCDSIRAKSKTTGKLTASKAKEVVDDIEIINNKLLDGSIKEFVVPEEVTELRPYAFAGTDLEKITLHDGVKKIHSYCFDNTYNLKHPLIIPENIEFLGDSFIYPYNHVSAPGTSETIYDSQGQSVGTVWYCGNEANPKKVIIDSDVHGYDGDYPGFSINANEVEFLTGGTIYHAGTEHQETSFIFPSNIKGIAGDSFWWNGENNKITAISFEEDSQLQYICGTLADTQSCPNLHSIYIPKGSLLSKPKVNYTNTISGGNQIILWLGKDVSRIGYERIYNNEGRWLTIEEGETPLVIENLAFFESGLPILVFPKRLTTTGPWIDRFNSKLQRVFFNGPAPTIDYSQANSNYIDWFYGCKNLTDIYVTWSEGEVPNAPWGAYNATIHYNYVPNELVGTWEFNEILNLENVPSFEAWGENNFCYFTWMDLNNEVYVGESIHFSAPGLEFGDWSTSGILSLTVYNRDTQTWNINRKICITDVTELNEAQQLALLTWLQANATKIGELKS